MKITTRFILTLSLFLLILIGMAVSLIYTNQQVERLVQQEVIAHRIERGADELSYLTGDYLMYGESQQRARWEASFASFTEDVSGLEVQDPELQAIVAHIEADRARLWAVFDDVAGTLNRYAQFPDARPDPAFTQLSWSRMEVQVLAVAFEASLLSQKLGDQADRLKQMNLVLMFSLIGIFGLSLLGNYYLIYQGTLRSIAELHTGTQIIGSGNLDYTIPVKRMDEIGELSLAFNKMTASLKEVTASKADLEREIAERQKVESRLQAVLESSPDPIYLKDRDSRLLLANPATFAVIGKPAEAVLGKTDAEFYDDPATGRAIMENDRRILDSGRMEVVEESIPDEKGTRVLLSTKAPYCDPDGQVIGLVGVSRDITERKRAEEALRWSERRYRSFVEVTNQWAWVTDPSGLVVEDIPALRAFTGQTYEQARDDGWADALHPDDVQRTLQVWDHAVATRMPYQIEYRMRRHDGTYRLLLARGVPILDDQGSVIEWVGTCIDITESKQAELAVRESEERLRITLSSIGDAVLTTDAQGVVTYLNPVAERLTGWPTPEAAGLPLGQVLPLINEITHQPTENPVVRVLQTGQVVGLGNHTALVSRDGRVIPIEDSAAPIMDAAGCPVGVVLVFHDVSEKRQAEAALLDSHDRLRLTTGAAEIGLWEWDVPSNTATLDERCLSLFGLPAGGALAYPEVLQAIHPDDRAGLETALQAALVDRSVFHAEFRIPTSDGTVRWVYARGQGVYDPAGNPCKMPGVVMDITGRKAVEAEILANQARLEVQRRLIEQREQERQRIARDLHDGPVQALLAATFALHGLREVDCSDEVRRALEHIQASVQEQVNELRAYAGELRPPILAKFGLAKAIRSHLDSFRPKHPGITINFEETSVGPLLPEPARVTLYRIYQESLANLVRHAQASEVTIRLTKMDHQAHLDIQDNGVGFTVPEDWLELARHGHLGLVGMRERAEAVGGSLAVASQPGQGTCIQVIVPIQPGEDPLDPDGRPAQALG